MRNYRDETQRLWRKLSEARRAEEEAKAKAKEAKMARELAELELDRHMGQAEEDLRQPSLFSAVPSGIAGAILDGQSEEGLALNGVPKDITVTVKRKGG